MVRTLLILTALALFGCDTQPLKKTPGARAPQTAVATKAEQDPHGSLACAACHRGKKADVGRAPVPREACTGSGCHEDAGPPQVTVATARFEHRNHGLNGEIALSCAGCHTHDSGQDRLRASVDACALCHAQKLEGTKGDDCRLCHGQPKHMSLTSQGIPIRHDALPWLETGCARCHYDVLGAQSKVSLDTCSKCHARTMDVTRLGIARDLHLPHRGVGCTSCHQAGLHRIGAMSSAVNLQCADCHDRVHDQPVPRGAQACSKCHAHTHSAQQRLVLGIVGSEPVLPSAKFLMGLTCRSCHVPPGLASSGSQPRRGQAAACVACHEKEYARVLAWWGQGLRARDAAASAYVRTARGALNNAADTSRALLSSAESKLALVREAGGQHNLELSDLVFRTSVNDAVTAYRLAGRLAPPTPTFGNTPHVGTCSFCHYAGDDWNYRALQPGLHERLIRTKAP